MTITYMEPGHFQWELNRTGLREAREHLGLALGVRIDRADLWTKSGVYLGIRKGKHWTALDLPADSPYKFGHFHWIKVSKHLDPESANETCCHELVHARQREQKQIHGIKDEQREREALEFIERVQREQRLGEYRPNGPKLPDGWSMEDYKALPNEAEAFAEAPKLAKMFTLAIP